MPKTCPVLVRPRIEIDCSLVSWKPVLEASIRQGSEADLINFNFAEHGEHCAALARRFQIEFRPARDPSERIATFRFLSRW